MGTKRFRGVPQPLSFSISALADDTLLTEIETAAALRESIIGVSKKRLAGTDDLEWRYISGRPRCVAGSLKKKMAGSSMRLPGVPKAPKAKAKQSVHPGTKMKVQKSSQLVGANA